MAYPVSDHPDAKLGWSNSTASKGLAHLFELIHSNVAFLVSKLRYETVIRFFFCAILIHGSVFSDL